MRYINEKRQSIAPAVYSTIRTARSSLYSSSLCAAQRTVEATCQPASQHAIPPLFASAV